MRPPEDEAADAVMVDHEAERQDLEATMLADARAKLERAIGKLLDTAAAAKPDKRAIAAQTEQVTRLVMLAVAAQGNAFARMVTRQVAEKRAAFGKRSGQKIVIAPITKKRIAERKAAIEAARKVEA